MAWLNPFTWIKILSLLKSLYDAVVTTYRWIAAAIRTRQQEKKIDGLKDAEKQIGEANKIENEEQRLKEKADAACKIEQNFDPDRKC